MMEKENTHWITQNEVLRKLQISRTTLVRWRKHGYLRAYSFRGSRILYFDDAEIDEIIRGNFIDETNHFDTMGFNEAKNSHAVYSEK